eukprot:1168875-Rhodomonas_salina.2
MLRAMLADIKEGGERTEDGGRRGEEQEESREEGERATQSYLVLGTGMVARDLSSYVPAR